MKLFFLATSLFVFNLLCETLFAQDEHVVQWSVHIDGYNDAEVTASAIDKEGNSYYTLTYTADLDIQGLMKKFPYSPYISSAILKISSEGKPQWAHAIQSTKDCRLTAIEIGPSGNVYITGHGDGVVKFESNNKEGQVGALKNKNGYAEPSGIIVACYAPSGELQWNKKFESSYAGGLSIACNSKEDIYIPFHQNFDLMDENGTVLSPFKRSNIHDSKQGVLKLTKTGDVLGVIELSVIASSTYIHRMGGKFDNADNYILYGTMYGAYHFGKQDSILADVSKSSLDSYLAKFDPTGKMVWYQHIGGRNTQWIRDVDIDQNNSIVALVSYDKECFVSKGMQITINSELYGKYGTDFTFFKLFPNGELDYRYTYVHPVNAYNILPMYIDLASDNEIVMTGNYNDTLQIGDKTIYAGFHNPLPMRMHWDKTEIRYLAKMGDSDYFFTPTAQDVNGKYFCGAAHYAGKKNELINKSSKIKLNNRDYGRASVIYGATLVLKEKEPEETAKQEKQEKKNAEIIQPLMDCLSAEDTHTWLPMASEEIATDPLNSIDSTGISSPALLVEALCYTKTLEIEASVFPNPTRGTFTTTVRGLSGENLEIEMYSEAGQLLFTHRDRSTNNNISLEMNSTSLAAGVYFIRIIAAQHQKVVRLVVVK